MNYLIDLGEQKTEKKKFSFKRFLLNVIYLCFALAWLYVAFRLWVIFIKFAVNY